MPSCSCWEDLRLHTVTIGEDYSIRLPRWVCELLDLRPGDEVRFISRGGSTELVKAGGIGSLRGILKGCDLSDYREE